MALNSINKKFLIPTLVLAVALFCGLGGFMAKHNNESIQSMMDSKGDAVASFVTKVSADYFAIFDFSDFENYSKALESDPEVEFAVFYNADKEALNENTKVPEDISSLIIFDREIKDEEGNIQGYLTIGYNKTYLEKSLSDSIKIVTVSTVFALLLFTLGVIFLVRKIITVRVKTTVNMLRDIAEGEGDLTKRLHADSDDELGDMAKWFNKFINNIHEIISTVQINAQGVSTASTQLSSTADNLFKGSNEQKLQTEQVASAMSEMSQSIIDVVRNAEESSKASINASDIAGKGRDVVEKTVAGMKKIASTVQETSETVEKLGASSAEIGDILNVINDIAAQTNLLALNAAIEAARAGEHGRGFAVVADEVRKLADNTAEATHKISEMVATIQQDTEKSVNSMNAGRAEVENGVQLAEEAMKALEMIVDTSGMAANIVKMITQATGEQSSTTDLVSENMETILNVTQQSVAATNEIKMSSEELGGLSAELQSKIGLFKV
jgi:methyl-accepting chemotaxis protein